LCTGLARAVDQHRIYVASESTTSKRCRCGSVRARIVPIAAGVALASRPYIARRPAAAIRGFAVRPRSRHPRDLDLVADATDPQNLLSLADGKGLDLLRGWFPPFPSPQRFSA
jgi:hypothetical protein